MACREELEDFKRTGGITELILAYSREAGMPRQYVQDAVKAKAELVRKLLKPSNSHVYTCGDSNMSHAVSAAIAGIIGKHLSMC